jgi:pimeloyl-ACP methyl ester carboxylesterase
MFTPLLASAGYRVIVPYLRGYGTTRFLSGETFRNGQPSAVALDIVALMDALEIPKATLAGFDWGARTANIVAALWPEHQGRHRAQSAPGSAAGLCQSHRQHWPSLISVRRDMPCGLVHSSQGVHLRRAEAPRQTAWAAQRQEANADAKCFRTSFAPIGP